MLKVQPGRVCLDPVTRDRRDGRATKRTPQLQCLMVPPIALWPDAEIVTGSKPPRFGRARRSRDRVEHYNCRLTTTTRITAIQGSGGPFMSMLSGQTPKPPESSSEDRSPPVA